MDLRDFFSSKRTMVNPENAMPDRPEARYALYAQMQALWATTLPTIDLTQEFSYALTASTVSSLRIDTMGLLRYDTIGKQDPSG